MKSLPGPPTTWVSHISLGGPSPALSHPLRHDPQSSPPPLQGFRVALRSHSVASAGRSCRRLGSERGDAPGEVSTPPKAGEVKIKCPRRFLWNAFPSAKAPRRPSGLCSSQKGHRRALFLFGPSPPFPSDSWPGVHVSGAQYTRAGRVHVSCGHTLTWGAIEAQACPRPARGLPEAA